MISKNPKTPSRGRSIAMLAVFLAMTLGRLQYGATITAISAGTWYQALHKVSFNPPDWVFRPVWITLYLAMSVAAWRVWRRSDASGRRFALALFTLQLFLNAVWSYLFFGYQMVGVALIELIVLEISIVATFVCFNRIDRWAGILFIPYVLWVAFAGILNAAIFALN
jgi:benzodiazapine receptor